MLRLISMDVETHNKLRKMAGRSRDGVARTRAQILSQMAYGRRLSDVADYANVSVQYARQNVRAFNALGMASLPPRQSGGRPLKFSLSQCEDLAVFVGKDRKTYRFPWTTWSIKKIHQAAVFTNIIPNVSKEAVRRALLRCGISYQRHRTWKHSNDPGFGNKWRRIKSLYAACPKRSAVICVDEFGPLECRPYMGTTWAKQGKVQRLPATYNRPHGVRHMFGFYDVHADVLGGFFDKRKRGEEFKDFLEQIRMMYPRWMRLYIILDNFSPHLRKDVIAWAQKTRMEFVLTATNASWMNRIEAHAYSFATCDRCREQDTAKMLIEYINDVSDEMKAEGRRVIMWGDELLRKDEWKAPCFTSGTLIADALPMLSRDVVVADWQYNVKDSHVQMSKHLMNQGLDTLLCP